MFDSVFRTVEKVITEFSWRRLFALTLLLAFASAAILFFEYSTAYFRLGRLSREVELLERLDQLAQAPGIQQSPQLERLRDELVSSLETLVGDEAAMTLAAPSLPSWLWRALASALPWGLLSLAFLSQMIRGDQEAAAAFVGVLFFAVLFGAIGAAIPTTFGPIVNYIAYPAGHFLLVVTLIMLWQKRQERRKSAT